MSFHHIQKNILPINIVFTHGFCRAVMLLLMLFCLTSNGFAQSRLKDIASFEGIRENLLVGYGLVVGLNGTGDDLRSAVFTQESLIGMLERLGVNARNASLNTKNVAAVTVTARLPPFAANGTNIDVKVSALGSASSLEGGTLLATPLVGADDEVYAVAQGNIDIGTFASDNVTQVRNIPTNGMIINGGIVEKEITFILDTLKKVNISLHNPDLTTARRVASAINGFIGESVAFAISPSTVHMQTLSYYFNGVVGMLTDVEQLRIEPDQPAKVVIDEKSGVIVMGKDVRVSTIAIAQENLTITIADQIRVQQQQPFNNIGSVNTDTELEIDEKTIDDPKQLGVVYSGLSLQELVNGLNSLGVSPREMITILYAIKAAGALQADIEVL